MYDHVVGEDGGNAFCTKWPVTHGAEWCAEFLKDAP